MDLIVELPPDCNPTRLDFGYVEAYTTSGPYSCWMQVNSRMYRGNGNSMQEAFDKMKQTYLRNEPAFVQQQAAFEKRKELAKKDIKDLF